MADATRVREGCRVRVIVYEFVYIFRASTGRSGRAWPRVSKPTRTTVYVYLQTEAWVITFEAHLSFCCAGRLEKKQWSW